MKKLWLFSISTFIALTIAFYSKKAPSVYTFKKNSEWKTFEKKTDKEISSRSSTQNELSAARIPVIKRDIAQIKQITNPDSDNEADQNSTYLYRDSRVLIGDIQKNNYQDLSVELEMINKQSSNWKEILGNDLVRFQKENTKVLIKEEFPVIKVQNGKGQFLEQVIITYLSNNGNLSSYRALVDSESGSITETWDKTIHEKAHEERAGFTLPLDDSGIIAR